MFLRSTHVLLGTAIAALLAAGVGTVLTDEAEPSTTVVAAAVSPVAVVSEPTIPTPAAAVPDPAPPVAPAVTTPPPPLPPPPAPVARTEPAPAPAPTAPDAPTTASGAYERATAALVEAVPANWRDTLPVTIEIIEGSTSWASSSMEIRVGRIHAEGRWSHLVSVLGHEFGHVIAFAFGTRAYPGAPPEGWPDPNHGPPEEAWADCVAQAFTGIVDPSYGMPPCPSGSLDWTASWLAAGPP